MAEQVHEGFQALRELERRRAKEDLFYLAKYVLGAGYLAKADKFDWHHKELCDDLMRLWRTRHERPTKTTMKVEWPRGTMKSTICTVAFPVWVLLNEPETRILIESESAKLAYGFLAQIKGCFESKHFTYLFGQLFDPKHRWNLEELTVRRTSSFKEPSIEVGGIEANRTGRHYDLFIGDDIQAQTNSQTRDMIEKVIAHAKDMYPLVNPQGMLLFPMTRWAHGDLGGWMDEINEADDEAFRERTIYVNRYICWKRDKDGNAIYGEPEFPTILTREELDSERMKQGPYKFSCNYLLSPTNDETALFKAAWIKYHRHSFDQLRPHCNFYIAVDPAGEGTFKAADYTAIVVVAIDHLYNIFVVEVIREHLSRTQMAETLFDLAKRYRPEAIGVEAVLKQRELFSYLKMQAQLSGRYLPLKEFKTSNRTKIHRIRELVPMVESGKFQIRRDQKHLEDEMLRFPRGQHDDCLDAAAYTLEFLRTPATQQPKAFWDDPNWAKNWDRPEPKPTSADVKFWDWERRQNNGGARRFLSSRPL